MEKIIYAHVYFIRLGILWWPTWNLVKKISNLLSILLVNLFFHMPLIYAMGMQVWGG